MPRSGPASQFERSTSAMLSRFVGKKHIDLLVEDEIILALKSVEQLRNSRGTAIDLYEAGEHQERLLDQL